ncbi:MAG: imidazoleglycerol-phosphate dehydratase HisB [Acidimicrobiia bacterium]
MTRTAQLSRLTTEVGIEGAVTLDGTGISEVSTGLGFLDHMLTAYSKHGQFDITLAVEGDTEVDDHHTVEDCAIALGRGFNLALGDRRGIERFGSAYVPLDEALVRVVVDLSGRGWPEVHLPFGREMVGDVATENIVHFFRSFAVEGRLALHVDAIRGDNSHHVAEASFKALARAMRTAVQISGEDIPSTKGTLT